MSMPQAELAFTTDFTSRYAEPLRTWGKLFSAYSGPIVAISRKGPRLLELAVRASVLPESLLSRVTTERGFFIDPPVCGVADTSVLCDDCIIIGSTFQRLFALMSAVHPHSRLVGLPFALSKKAKIDRNRVIERAAMGLAPDDCASFVNAETAAFAALDKPYDLDHPIISLQLQDGVGSATVHSTLRDVAAMLGGQLYATPRRFVDATGASRERHTWSLLLHDQRHGGEICCLRKIRCYLSEDQHRLLVVPIAQVAGTTKRRC